MYTSNLRALKFVLDSHKLSEYLFFETQEPPSKVSIRIITKTLFLAELFELF